MSVITPRFVFLLIALVCFLFAALDARFPRVNLLAGGLVFVTLAQLFA